MKIFYKILIYADFITNQRIETVSDVDENDKCNTVFLISTICIYIVISFEHVSRIGLFGLGFRLCRVPTELFSQGKSLFDMPF